MAAIASLVQPTINRKSSETRKNASRMSKTSNAGCRQGGSYAAGSSQDSQPVLSAKPEQALLSKSASFAAIG